MITLLTTLYILSLVFSFHYGNIIIGFSVLILEVISLFFIPVVINNQRKNIKNAIKDDNINKPILNVNKAPWYLLAELPEITQIEAKKMIHLRRKYGNYKSLDEFFKVNLINHDKKEKIEKYLSV